MWSGARTPDHFAMFCTWWAKTTRIAAALLGIAGVVAGCGIAGSQPTAAGGSVRTATLAPGALVPAPAAVPTTGAQPTAGTAAPRTAVRLAAPAPSPVAGVPGPAQPSPRPATAPPAVPVPTTAAGGAETARRNAAPTASPTPNPPPAPAPAPAPAANPNAYAFTLTNSDGTPIRWNPCAAIHYVTNLTEAPASAAGDVDQALRLLSAATGLTFVNDGSTTELPNSNRPVDQPGRYGTGHSPLLIAWVRRAETNIYGGEGPNTVGTAATTWIGATPGAANQEAAYVTGQVAIEPDATRSFPSGFGSGRTIGLALLHELGHIAGLAHVSDTNQVMYPDLMAVPAAAYAAGDRNGLQRVGTAGGCLPPR